MTAESAAVQVGRFQRAAKPGAEHFHDAAVQLAASLAGETAVLAEGELSAVELRLGRNAHDKHIDVTVLSSEALRFMPAATNIIEALRLGVQAQMERKDQ